MEQFGQILLMLFYLAFFPGVLALVFAPSVLAWRTERPSDVTTIKARYEGLNGVAGSNMKVTSIRRAGTQLASRYRPPARKYEVALARPDGSEFHEIIGVSAGYFDNGALVEVPGSAGYLKRRPRPL